MSEQREQSKTVVQRYFEALSGKEKPVHVVEQYVADEQLKQHIAVFEAAFPAYHLAPEIMFAEGDQVAVRAIFRGTHRGDLMGIAPTGKEVTLPVMLIYRLADGKIVEHWMGVDQLSLLQQLGAVPTSG